MPDHDRFDRLQQQISAVERKIEQLGAERQPAPGFSIRPGTAHPDSAIGPRSVEPVPQSDQTVLLEVPPVITPMPPVTGPAPTGAPEPAYDALRQDLKTRLTTLKVFTEEGWDDLWDGFSPDRRCRFAAQLVGLYLPENLGDGVYDEVDDWLKGAFAGAIELIRPRAGAQFDDAAHKAVSTVPRERGAFNVVHSLVRAGARCEGKVVRPASVIRVA